MYEAPFPMSTILVATRRVSMQYDNKNIPPMGFSSMTYNTAYISLADLPEPVEYITIHDSDHNNSDDNSEYEWWDQQRSSQYSSSLSSVSVVSERPRKLPSSASSLRKYMHDRTWRQSSRTKHWWCRLRQILLCDWCSTFIEKPRKRKRINHYRTRWWNVYILITKYTIEYLL
jgi:hypothetical protein